MKVLKSILNTVINILIVAVLIISIVVAALALTSKSSGISTIFGHTIQVIVSDSMAGGSDEFEGGDFARGRQVDYVLGEFTDEENKLMPERLKLFGDAVLSFVSIGPDRTMNTYNGK